MTPPAACQDRTGPFAPRMGDHYDRRTEEPRTSKGRCEHAMVTQERISIVVVLPAPFGPRKAKIAPVAPGHRCPRPPRGCRSA
jgi:hypothetical protein